MTENACDRTIIARWKTIVAEGGRTIRLLILHTMQAAEGRGAAEGVGNYFATTNVKASAHEGFDEDSTVRYVHDKDVAYGAVGANHDGKHYELAGFAEQSAAQWNDAASLSMLDLCARHVAADCIRYGIPVRRLTVAQVRDGSSKGITHHADVEAAFPSTGHTDVGPLFPWSYFLALVAQEVARLTNPAPEEDDMRPCCIPNWSKTQSNGRQPFFRVDAAPDLGKNGARVLATAGAPLRSGITIGSVPMKYGSIFGMSYVEIVGLAAPVDDISDDADGDVWLLCADGGTVLVARTPA